jgi:hypothetical protein
MAVPIFGCATETQVANAKTDNAKTNFLIFYNSIF